jgi:hypothetical protein
MAHNSTFSFGSPAISLFTFAFLSKDYLMAYQAIFSMYLNFVRASPPANAGLVVAIFSTYRELLESVNSEVLFRANEVILANTLPKMISRLFSETSFSLISRNFAGCNQAKSQSLGASADGELNLFLWAQDMHDITRQCIPRDKQVQTCLEAIGAQLSLITDLFITVLMHVDMEVKVILSDERERAARALALQQSSSPQDGSQEQP